MYGRLLDSHVPYLKWYDKSPFIETSDDFGEIDEKALDLVQEAYTCCADQLPSNPQRGALWVCNICERVWGVPPTGNDSWTLTSFRVVDSHKKEALAGFSYRWWIYSVISFSATIVGAFATFIVMLSANPSIAVYSSAAVLGLGGVITLYIGSRWRRLMNQYNFSISDR